MSTTRFSTSLPLPGYGSQSLVAEVLGADATATTYVLNCPPGTDGNDCGTYNNTVTVGPWGSKTIPAGAATTGNLDIFITMPSDDEDDWKMSVHCKMSHTVAKACTTINLGGNDDGSPTATVTASDELEMFDLTYAPVVITAGLDILNAKHTGVPEASATTTKGSEEGTATPTTTSGASTSFTRVFGAMSVAGIAASLKGDANGNTIFRKDSLGRKIACMNCINNHRSSNCLPSHNDDVRVVDGVGRKKGSKNLPKDSQKAKHKVKKPACPQKGSQGRILPLQNLQLRNIVQVQPAISRQAGAFLQQDIFGALPQANNVHSQPVPPASLSRPSPVVDIGHAAFQSVVNCQVTPEFESILNHWHSLGLSFVDSMNVPQHWGQMSATHGSGSNAGGTYFPGPEDKVRLPSSISLFRAL
ncbi:unnamed protein product [Fusarium graminearum]|nr:unnamed protein product [Fusarium graminearum]